MVVFRAVVSWVADMPEERLPALPGLLRLVRFPLFTYSELQEALGCSLLCRSSGARGLLEVLQSLLKGDYRGPECRPRTPNQVLRILPYILTQRKLSVVICLCWGL